MLKNLIIFFLALIASSLLVENRQACAEVQICGWIRSLLDQHELQRQRNMETIKQSLETIRVLPGHASN